MGRLEPKLTNVAVLVSASLQTQIWQPSLA